MQRPTSISIVWCQLTEKNEKPTSNERSNHLISDKLSYINEKTTSNEE
jgi:hypothetical protein